MAKRFVNPDWKTLRHLSANLQRAYFYCWDKADACGVYEHDKLYMKADLGITITLDELAKLPGVRILSGGRVFFTDFILVNYGTLKEGYNPHKPAFRALEKNQISSLNQACPILEEEGEEEDEGKDEKEEEGVLKLENPFGKNFTDWDGWKTYKHKEHREKYKAVETEQAAINKLFELSRGDPAAARAIIQQSIANRWKGLFEIKNHGATKNNSGFTRAGIQAELSKRLASRKPSGDQPDLKAV
jgi:hypothetical protein